MRARERESEGERLRVKEEERENHAYVEANMTRKNKIDILSEIRRKRYRKRASEREMRMK